jgi:hypothetical protein
MWRFSPRTPPSNDFLLPESSWYCLGYAALIVGIGVLLLFREPSGAMTASQSSPSCAAARARRPAQ